MSRPAISTRSLTDTLEMSECHPTSDHKGKYWLYDKTRSMNLAMGAETEEEAFVKTITYYQKRLSDLERCYSSLKGRVDSFVSSFSEDEDS